MALGFACLVWPGGAGADGLLIEGDRAVLEAPEASFASEIERLKLGQSKFKAVPPPEGYAQQSLDGDLFDLRHALKEAKVSQPDADAILADHRAEREALLAWVDTPQPTNFPLVTLVRGLPDEFADYLEGLIAWHKCPENKATARVSWERLLNRAPAERKYKSTWAAYMLGRSWEKEDPIKAREYFSKVRELNRGGFRDTIGLAAASLGLEAKMCLKGKEFEQAIELYLEQQATGDSTAIASLRIAAATAVRAGPAAQVQIAKNPICQRVITAYLIAHPACWNDGGQSSEGGSSAQNSKSVATEWLAAVAQAGVKDSDSAEKFALLAYQAGDFALAQKWIERAGRAPMAQWVQAKLFLRSRELKKGGAILAWLSRALPVTPHGTNDSTIEGFPDVLSVHGEEASRAISAELGVVQLAQGDYQSALESLLQAGHWEDAAYIAERVLTVDELKTYVDRHWPAASEMQEDIEKEQFGNDNICPVTLRQQIRHLLGRRLMRAYRSGEAREYFPAACLASLQQWLRGITRGWDQSLSAKERAEAFFVAALVTREEGMELLSTEVEPDWHMHRGRTDGSISQERANSDAQVVKASPDEVSRARQHRTNPDERFHYRYLAASIGWAAARLMPDDSDETAQVLWTAGSWVKYLDPSTADIFYKALVRRNPHTALGAEAARKRWFPPLNEDGSIFRTTASLDLVQRRSGNSEIILLEHETAEASGMTDALAGSESDANVAPERTQEEEQVEHGYRYIVQAGDTLAEIARAYNEAGVPVTVADIREANDLGIIRLCVGQVLFIPVKVQPISDPPITNIPLQMPEDTQ